MLWNKKRGHDETMAHQWEKLGGTVIVAENGYLQQTDKTYYALFTHGHNGSGWFPVGADDRFAKLSFAIKPPRDDGEYILVREQRIGIGSQLMAQSTGLGAEDGRHLATARAVPGAADGAPRRQEQAGEGSGGHGRRAQCRDLEQRDRRAGLGRRRAGAALRAALDLRDVGEDREVAPAHGACQWHFDEIASGEPFAHDEQKVGPEMALTLYPVPGKEKSS